MNDNSSPSKEWIKIVSKKKYENAPSEIRIDIDGLVYIDGELYDPANTKYQKLSVDVEKHNRLSTGEETEKIIEASKKTKKGETVIIKDLQGPDKMESTTVKF